MSKISITENILSKAVKLIARMPALDETTVVIGKDMDREYDTFGSIIVSVWGTADVTRAKYHAQGDGVKPVQTMTAPAFLKRFKLEKTEAKLRIARVKAQKERAEEKETSAKKKAKSTARAK